MGDIRPDRGSRSQGFRNMAVVWMSQSLAVREGFLEEEGQPRRQVGFKRTGPSLVGAIAPTLAYGGLYPHRVPGVRILGESLAISRALLRIAHLHVSVPTALTPYYL